MLKRLALLPFGIVAVSGVSMAVAPTAETTVIDLSSDAVQEITTTTAMVTTTTAVEVAPPPVPTTSTTTTTTIPAGDWMCPEWLGLAVENGWASEQLPRLDTIMHRESTCHMDSYNDKDPYGGSYGLMQINGYWCSSTKYHPAGWLQEQGILYTCNDLFDPATNLRAALAIWQRSGWSPW